MPSSYHGFIKDVLDVYIQKAPQKVLDIGIGFGKWGYLFREYGDVFRGRIYKDQWQVRVDGVEAYKKYIHDAHHYVYDNIFNADIVDQCDKLETYDFIFAADIIEHLDKDVAITVLNKLKSKTKCLAVIIPLGKQWVQSHLEEDDFETHRSVWEVSDFDSWNGIHKVLLNRGKVGKPIGFFTNEC